MRLNDRIGNATRNALKVYDNFTTDDDSIGLFWFDHELHCKLGAKLPTKQQPKGPLVPRFQGGVRNAIDNTKGAVRGGTAFYDALIEMSKVMPTCSNHYLVALTDGADGHSKQSINDAIKALTGTPWKLLLIGLEVQADVRARCEELVAASEGGVYVHAADAGAALDAAFATVAANFVMPKVKSANSAASGGGARGM